MNSVNLTGRLCADPELRRTGDGTGVCSYTIAVKRPMAKDVTDFIDIVSWRQSAEYLSNHAKKGDLVAVSGILQIRNWEDKNGNKRRSWEVVTNSVELMTRSRKDENQQGNSQYGQQGYCGYQTDYQMVDEEDAKCPF